MQIKTTDFMTVRIKIKRESCSNFTICDVLVLEAI